MVSWKSTAIRAATPVTLYGMAAYLSGSDWLYAGTGISSSTTIYGGSGLDEIYGGTGTNWIYGNGVHDLLQGGSGDNFIMPKSGESAGSLASIQVESHGTPQSGINWGLFINPGEQASDFTHDGTIDNNGNSDLGDYDKGYGGDWTFNDFDSGVRLGESDTTPVAVYATWLPGDPNGKLWPGGHWESDARYTITGTADGLTHVIHDIDQTVSPDSDAALGDRPWRLLGVYNVNVGSELNVELSYDTSNGKMDSTHSSMLCVSDVMIHPLWPVVSIRPTNVSVNTKVAVAHAGDYVDWVDACQPISIPVEGQGDRIKLQLQASIDPIYAQIGNLAGVSMSNWQAQLNIDPVSSGLQLWSSSIGGSALTAAAFNAMISSGNYDGTVWISASNSEDPQLLWSYAAAAMVVGADIAVQPTTENEKVVIPAFYIHGSNKPFLRSSISTDIIHQ